ncbi:MAG: alpha/beta hydrolase [Rhizobiales bacterium TMED83]|nr:lipase [Rhodobiaceae bacterium]RPF93582.1 MAG: alpha/beta hydrolase [Rhizobiales bacterium TMED83]
MSKSSYIDPDLLPGLERLAEAGGGFDLRADLDTARRASQARDDSLIAQLEVPESIVQETVSVTSGDGHIIDLRICRPAKASAPLPVFYWMHGGGYVLGSARQGDAFTLRAAGALGMFAVSVEYRLAPETAYPGPLEDCYEGLAYLVENATALNLDTGKIIIGGVSAGGGLCAGLGLLVRDRAAFSLLGQLLLYPMIDDRNIAPASDELPDTLVWTRAANLFGWQSYLGDLYGSDDIPIYAAAARAHDLSGLPPTYLPVGDLDLFLDENIAYAHKLMQVGTPTHFHVFPGAYHGFNGFAAEAPVSVACNAEIFSFVAKLLAEANAT